MIGSAAIIAELERRRVTDVVGLPDNSSAALFARLAAHDAIALRGVTREGEAFALASGLWIGGRHPVVVVQNTGLLESGDSLRGTAMRMRVPLVCLVTYRGFARTIRGRAAPALLDGELLARPELDSVALVTEPTLAAWGIPFEMLGSDDDLPRVAAAFDRARDLSQPVALLLTGETA